MDTAKTILPNIPVKSTSPILTKSSAKFVYNPFANANKSFTTPSKKLIKAPTAGFYSETKQNILLSKELSPRFHARI